MKKNYVTGTGELCERVQTALGDLGQTTPVSIRLFTGMEDNKIPFYLDSFSHFLHNLKSKLVFLLESGCRGENNNMRSEIGDKTFRNVSLEEYFKGFLSL